MTKIKETEKKDKKNTFILLTGIDSKKKFLDSNPFLDILITQGIPTFVFPDLSDLIQGSLDRENFVFEMISQDYDSLSKRDKQFLIQKLREDNLI